MSGHKNLQFTICTKVMSHARTEHDTRWELAHIGVSMRKDL